MLQTLPSASSQMQLHDDGQRLSSAQVLAELQLSAADNRNNSPKRQLSSAAHRKPTPATSLNIKDLLPDEKLQQSDGAEHPADPSGINSLTAQPHKQLLSTAIMIQDFQQKFNMNERGRCRCWWPPYAHCAPNPSPWPTGQGHTWTHSCHPGVSAEPSCSATKALAHFGHSQRYHEHHAPLILQNHLGTAANSASTHSSASPRTDLQPAVANAKSASSDANVGRPRQQPVPTYDDSVPPEVPWSPNASQAGSDFNSLVDGSDIGLATIEALPPDDQQKLAQLQEVFPTLPPHIVANEFHVADCDESRASDACLSLVALEAGPLDEAWSESGSPSDADTQSVATDSQFEAASPMPARSSTQEWLDPSESLQELSLEAKVAMLQLEFEDVPAAQIQDFLDLAEGVVDTALALLVQHVEDQKHEEEKQRRREQDRKFALQLANEGMMQPETPTEAQQKPSNPPQDEEHALVDTMIATDPKLESKLYTLQQRFPTVERETLANILMANDGHVESASQCLAAAFPAEDGPPSSSIASPHDEASNAVVARAMAAQYPPRNPAGRPVSPPPGFSQLRIQAPKPIQAPRHRTKPDIYQDARLKFKEAQEHIVQCNREFHEARRCQDMQKQKHWSSQLAYWQSVAKEEKLRASKKIFTSKNAEVINTYKLDLHALHVDEAIQKIQETRRDLRKFPCTWQVEAVTGYGLHSTSGGPKLLPAVRQYLDNEGIEWWSGNPGMVVFQLNPKPEA